MFHIETTGQPLDATITVQPISRADLSEDQVKVYDAVMDWHKDPNARQYLKLGGYAGTGKTTVTAALAKELEAKGENIAYCAYTGKAVNVLQRKLIAAGVKGHCSTLHSLMYKATFDKNGKILAWERLGDLPFSFIIVDEASMVGADLWNDLLSFGLPILAVGDHGQLPPVGRDVVNLMQSPDLRLEKIHRQASGNPILALAQHVREGNSHKTFQPTDARVTFVPSASAIGALISADPLNFGAICYTNKTRASLNKFIRTARGITDVYPMVNDIVICLRNKKPIFNGMRGKLVNGSARETDEYDNFDAIVDFPDDGMQLHGSIHLPQFSQPKTFDDLVPLKLKYSNNGITWNHIGMLFDYGYAMTCHKAQGSQFPKVCIVWENLFRDNDTRARWMYTAVTRASEQLYIVKP